MANVTVTLSSEGTTRAVNLDWMSGKPVAIAVTGSSSGTFAYTVQYTLDDLQTSSGTTWINDPNATALTSNSSGIYLYQQPLAAIRLNSTAMSSAALNLWVKQATGWA